MSSKVYNIISADDHVQEPPDAWQSRVVGKLKPRAPKIVSTPQGDVWEVDGKIFGALGLSAQAGRKYEDYKASGDTYSTIRKGTFDPGERLKDMAVDGIDAQVLFPNLAIGCLYSIKDFELQLACLRAYNDFLADFCSVAPDSLLGIGLLPTDDVSEAVKEIARVAKLPGLRGVLVPTYPGKSSLEDPAYEPIWAAAQDHALPMHIHLITGTGTKTERFVQLGSASALCSEMANHSMACYETLSKLIFAGIFERFPKLKFVSVEGNIGWIGYFLGKCDMVYRRHRFWTKLDLPKLPSEYFRQSIYATFIEDKVGVRIADMIGEDNLMWSSDYPHTDTTWPNSRQFIDDQFAGLPERLKHKIVSGNAQKLYQL
jgi:predicted TIM-barrel fold metal-dependent hydrolase